MQARKWLRQAGVLIVVLFSVVATEAEIKHAHIGPLGPIRLTGMSPVGPMKLVKIINTASQVKTMPWKISKFLSRDFSTFQRNRARLANRVNIGINQFRTVHGPFDIVITPRKHNLPKYSVFPFTFGLVAFRLQRLVDGDFATISQFQSKTWNHFKGWRTTTVDHGNAYNHFFSMFHHLKEIYLIYAYPRTICQLNIVRLMLTCLPKEISEQSENAGEKSQQLTLGPPIDEPATLTPNPFTKFFYHASKLIGYALLLIGRIFLMIGIFVVFPNRSAGGLYSPSFV